MLQFVTADSDRYSIPEQVQMAIEGGCRWIQLRIDGASDDDFRNIAQEVIPLCRENEAFLLFDNRIDLSMQMGVHGVHLPVNGMNPLVVRENLGPEAIIGCTAHTADDIIRLKGYDVDYVDLGPIHGSSSEDKAQHLTMPEIKAIIEQVRKDDILLPVVACSGVTIEDIPALMESGVNGISMSEAIVEANDPVNYTKKVIDTIAACTKSR